MKKMILLLLSVMLCLTGCTSGIMHTVGNIMRHNEAKVSEPAQKNVIASSAEKEVETRVEKEVVDDVDYGALISNEPEADIEDYIQTYIRPFYNAINENVHSYEQQTYDGATMWSDDVYCVKKELPAGARGNEYARQYYYKGPEGELVFAFVFKGKEEHRLYFKDEKLIRYIDEAGSIMNNPTSQKALAMAEAALEEAYH